MSCTRSCGATYGRLLVKSFTGEWSYAVIDRSSAWKTQRAAKQVCVGLSVRHSFSQHDFMLAGHWPHSLLIQTMESSTLRECASIFIPTINLQESNRKHDGVSDAACSNWLLSPLSVNTQLGISISWLTRCCRGCFCAVLKERQPVCLSDWQHTRKQLWECNICIGLPIQTYWSGRLRTSCKINQTGIKLKWQYWRSAWLIRWNV